MEQIKPSLLAILISLESVLPNAPQEICCGPAAVLPPVNLLLQGVAFLQAQRRIIQLGVLANKLLRIRDHFASRKLNHLRANCDRTRTRTEPG